MEVKAVHCDDGVAYREESKPGEFNYFTTYKDDRVPRGMTFVCPCGCGDISALDFRPENKPNPD